MVRKISLRCLDVLGGLSVARKLISLPAAWKRFFWVKTTLKLPNVQCFCGKHKLTPEHALSCAKIRARFTRHDVLVLLIYNMLLNAGVVAAREVLISADSSLKMDIVVYNADGTKMWIDVTVINPLAPSNRKSKNPIEKREKAKIKKYHAEAQVQGVRFIAAAIDVYGMMGKGMLTVLKHIAVSARKTSIYAPDCSEAEWEGKYAYVLKKFVSTTLAYGNHLVVEEAVMSSLRIKGIASGVQRAATLASSAHFWTRASFVRPEVYM